MIKYEDKIKGAFYGFAVGDAMGATTEFMTKEQIKKTHGTVKDIIGGGWLKIKAGEVTDDTQMMLCVFDALKKSEGSINKFLYNCCGNFIDWYNSGPIDIGGQCLRVISSFRQDKNKNFNDWFDAAYNSEALGNGGLMRALPAALYNRDFALSQNNLTHNNFTCVQVVDVYYNTINAILNDVPKEKLSSLIRMGGISRYLPTGHVLNTFNNAVYWFLHTDSFEDCIIHCVNDGGDADTISAIAGSIAGLFYGYDNIPKRWRDKLNGEAKEKISEASNWFINYKNNH